MRWGNEHGVLIATTTGQAYRALEMAGEFCGRLNDPRDPSRNKFAVLIEATARTTGTLRFDCVSHPAADGPIQLNTLWCGTVVRIQRFRLYGFLGAGRSDRNHPQPRSRTGLERSRPGA